MKIPVKTVKHEDAMTEPINQTQGEETGETPVAEQHPQPSQSDQGQTVPVHEEIIEGSEDAPSPPSTQEMVHDVEPEAVSVEVTPEVVAEEDELSRLKKQLQTKEQEVKEQYDARLRLQAEMENFKKRKEKETSDFRKYANTDIVTSLLPVIEDFERAIAAAEQTHKLEDFLKGIELIFGKFFDALQKKGLKEIEAAVGQVFNPEIHEAVMQIETDEVEEGMIAQVFQKGYYLHERVVQAPKVGVAKKKT